MSERMGFLHLDSWSGRIVNRVAIIGETPKRYRIRALKETWLGGRYRRIQAGETALVPKQAIAFEEPTP